MRNGYRIYDADTHAQATAEAIEPFVSQRLRELVDLEAMKTPITIGHAGEVRQEPLKHRFRGGGGGEGWGGSAIRVLGEAAADPARERQVQKFMGSRCPTEGGVDQAGIRLRDMDEEGQDVHFMVPAGAGGHKNVEVEMELIRAGHRQMDAMCSEAPRRLKTAIVATAQDVAGSVAEIHRWGDTGWAVAAQPFLPLDYPIDHPDLEPIWKAASDYDLSIVHHSFAAGYPGYRDLWSNPFLGRLASHPWGAQRAVAAFICSGIMERYPALRFGVLESGFGWLPHWAKRMDDQVEYMGYVSPSLKQRPSEYLTGGRFFCSIVLHEGPEMVKMVNDMMGDHILMFGSDYPHAESRFPESVDKVLGWENLSEQSLRKLLWENAVKFFGEP